MDTPAPCPLLYLMAPFYSDPEDQHLGLRSTRELENLPDSSLLPLHEGPSLGRVSGIWSKGRNPGMPVSLHPGWTRLG